MSICYTACMYKLRLDNHGAPRAKQTQCFWYSWAHLPVTVAEILLSKVPRSLSILNYQITLVCLTAPSLVPRPSRVLARKRVWNLLQDFLALLNQHDDVFYVIQNDCHVLRCTGQFQCKHNTLGNWNRNRAVF